MKTRFSFVFLAAIIATLFFACSDMSVDSTDDKHPLAKNSYQNPYEEVGIVHNQALAYFLDNYDYGTATHQTVLDAITEFGLESGLSEEAMDTTITTTHEWYAAIGALITLPNGGFGVDINALSNFLQNLNTALELGTMTQEEYDELEPIVVATLDDTPLQVIKNMVAALPLDSYDPDEMAGLLYFESTYRHSAEFWEDYFSEVSNSQGAGIDLKKLILQDALGAERFLKITGADPLKIAFWQAVGPVWFIRAIAASAAAQSLDHLIKAIF